MKITTLPPGSPEIYNQIRSYERIVVLTEGFSVPFYATTAMSLLRYRRGDIIAVLDATENGKSADDLFGVGDTTPVVHTF